MSFFADREMIASGFTLGIIAIAIGCIVRFTRHTPLDFLYAYMLVAAGVVLLFASSLARRSRRNGRLLRYLLAAFTMLLLAGLLLRDAFQQLA